MHIMDEIELEPVELAEAELALVAGGEGAGFDPFGQPRGG